MLSLRGFIYSNINALLMHEVSGHKLRFWCVAGLQNFRKVLHNSQNVGEARPTLASADEAGKSR